MSFLRDYYYIALPLFIAYGGLWVYGLRTYEDRLPDTLDGKRLVYYYLGSLVLVFILFQGVIGFFR